MIILDVLKIYNDRVNDVLAGRGTTTEFNINILFTSIPDTIPEGICWLCRMIQMNRGRIECNH